MFLRSKALSTFSRRAYSSRTCLPDFVNEPILGYRGGSPERRELLKQITKFRDTVTEIPIIIGGREIKTGNIAEIRPPHDHQSVVGVFHLAGEAEIQSAIDTALNARSEWAAMSWDHRASLYLRLAELSAGPYRQILNAATVLGQSKNFYQTEIDAACEWVDFLRFNVKAAEQIFEGQPISSPGAWNRSEYRALEGFIYAVSPFNFTAIGGNLVAAPALMGNVVVWKPSMSAMLSGHVLMNLYKEAGFPDGVINFVPGDPEMITKHVVDHPQFAGLHFTGSTAVFNELNQKIANNLSKYRSYPRIVGETGGKNMIFAHKSADVAPLVTGIVRGAFEYAGQKCSACSRAYIPASLWPQFKETLVETMKKVKTGSPENPSVLVNAVITEKSLDKTAKYLQRAKDSNECEILVGGTVDKSVGWFVQPTVVVVNNPDHELMKDELFAPVVAIYVYPDEKFEETLDIASKTSGYGLTGAFWAKDRAVLEYADRKLADVAGNFYINDKCTGAVVGQQPFGGARHSGTNDKAGSALNLLRWTSVRSVKETFVPPTEVTYPYMHE